MNGSEEKSHKSEAFYCLTAIYSVAAVCLKKGTVGRLSVHVHVLVSSLKILNIFRFGLKRLRWSRDSVLAFGTQVRGFKPGRSRRKGSNAVCSMSHICDM